MNFDVSPEPVSRVGPSPKRESFGVAVRLLLGALAPLLLSIAVQAWLTREAEQRALEDRLATQTRTVGHLVASRLGPALDFDDSAAVGEMLDSLASINDFGFAIVWDGQGREVASRGPAAARDTWALGRRPLEQARFDVPGLVATEVAISAAGKPVGTLAVGFRTERAWRAAQRQALELGVVALLGAMAAVLVVLLLVRTIVRRNDALQRSLDRLLVTGTLARVGGWDYSPSTSRFRWSREAQELLGLGPTPELPAQEFLERLTPPSRGPLASALSACAGGGGPFEVEVRLDSAASGTSWLRVQGRVDGADGPHPRISGAIQDVTAQLEAREAALVASRMKTQFLANVSHELRTPLNGIIGMTELALDSPLTSEQREYLELVRTSGRNLVAIVNDILDVSRIEAGRITLEAEAFSLSRVVHATVQSLTPAARLKGLALKARIPADLPDRRTGDPVRLGQVLTNLVANAVKFTDRGEVDVEVRPGPGVDDVELVVRDTGVGIPADRQAAIFEAFIQADGGTNRRFGGTGLGLTISSHLLTLMQGRISVQSEVGRGSTFTAVVRLPRTDGPLPEAAPSAALAAARPLDASARLQVLLAEDNAINAQVALRLLERLGHAVQVVGDGQKACEAVAGGRVDLVLMDVQMPVLDGLEATRRIRDRERGTGQRVPIVALTANALPVDDERCRSAGMDGVLSKPIDLDLLKQTLARLRPDAARAGEGPGA